MADLKDIKGRFQAVENILSESATSIGKLRSVKTLLAGVNPQLDSLLSEYDKRLEALEMLMEGEVLQLAASEALPEDTEKEKKRKAALLLFLKSHGQVKEEVARVKAEMEKPQSSGAPQTSMWGNIFKAAKGPLALVTVIAVGIAVMSQTSVSIEIKNNGCGTLQASSAASLSIPGLSLPNKSIPSGDSATVVIPPLPVTVDGSQSGRILINATGIKLTFELSNVDDVTFDGASLLGVVTDLELAVKKNHELVLVCR